MVNPGTTSNNDNEALAQLRERLGPGARYDSPAAPARELAWARRGTAYFARKLKELPDEALDAPSLVPGWSRRHVIAHVSYQARFLARLAEAARTGAAEETLAEPENQIEDVSFGATLPAHALRYLFKHSEVHLNVEWRDLSEAGWSATIRALNGAMVDVRQTPWLRTREIWLRAVDLDNGGTFGDLPPDLLDELQDDILAEWAANAARTVKTPAMLLDATDRKRQTAIAGGGPRVSGKAADLVRWLSGRGARRLTFAGGEEIRLPAYSCGLRR